MALLVRDLPGVKVDIGRVLPGQLQHLVSQSSGKFSVPDFNGSFGPDNLIERFERKLPLPGLKHGSAHYEAVDLSDYLKQDGEERRGVFLLHVQGYDPASESGSPPAEPAPMAESGEGEGEGDGPAVERVDPSQKLDRRLILVTDLGLIAKQSPTARTWCSCSRSSAACRWPAPAWTWWPRTAARWLAGHRRTRHGTLSQARRPDARTCPVALLVKKAGDMSFLPLGKGDRSLDVSRFDVGGIANARSADQLSAYLFSDRGIYRPGDTFHIGMIVKAATWGQIGADGQGCAKTSPACRWKAKCSMRAGWWSSARSVRLAAGGFDELAHTTLDTLADRQLHGQPLHREGWPVPTSRSAAPGQGAGVPARPHEGQRASVQRSRRGLGAPEGPQGARESCRTCSARRPRTAASKRR